MYESLLIGLRCAAISALCEMQFYAAFMVQGYHS